MFLVPALMHFVRGVVSSKMGFTFAQNDLILTTVLYPVLLGTVWSAANVAVILKRNQGEMACHGNLGFFVEFKMMVI